MEIIQPYYSKHAVTGEQNGRSVITCEIARQIYLKRPMRHVRGHSATDVARAYGVSRHVIDRIWHEETWYHATYNLAEQVQKIEQAIRNGEHAEEAMARAIV